MSAAANRGPLPAATAPAPLLCLRNLEVSYCTRGIWQTVVRGVTFDLDEGRTLALVGESGSGKSTLALALMGLLPSGQARIRVERLELSGLNLSGLSEKQRRAVRGRRMAMVFQDPTLALNPVLTLGDQLIEVLRFHKRLPASRAHAQALDLLNSVGLPSPADRLGQYPHQLSGGMCQRVMIAMALAGEPDLLIADEPTSALDVTVAVQILDLLHELQRRRRLSMILITHDLGVAGRMAESVCVMHSGRIVESGPSAQVLQAPRHPYTQTLLRARPALGARLRERPAVPEVVAQGVSPAAILGTRNLEVHFTSGRWRRRRLLKAVAGVTLELLPGRTLGLVGESGCGKTTLGRALCLLQTATRGTVAYRGRDVSQLGRRELAGLRREVQVVFQSSSASLNPRITVARLVAEPLEIQGLRNPAERLEMVCAALDLVGLDTACLQRYPHELSGGQRQRVAMARALVTRPAVLICDEPTSNLDVSIQSQILGLLAGLQQRLGLSCLFISHDLAAVESLSHDIAVMHEGRIVEQGPTHVVCRNPQHPYTRALLSAAEALQLRSQAD